MIPAPSQGLADLAMKLATAVAPETASRFAMANTGMISALLGALAGEMEAGVAHRMADIEEMKALLTAAPEGAGDDPQARAAFVAKQPDSLSLSDVNALHAEGLTLLVELHAWAEQADATLNTRIWEFLLNHTERHRIELPGL
ncbi:MAG: hypothetical protein ACODAC_10300 [Pseudomonadota bacterium]